MAEKKDALTPRKIVAALDKYIISQDKAKKMGIIWTKDLQEPFRNCQDVLELFRSILRLFNILLRHS